MSKIAEPAKAVTRRFGALVVRIDRQGVSVRGYRRRRWYLLPWADVANAAARKHPPAGRGWTEKQWANVLKTIGAK
jgi:hypothetical protein